MPEQINSISQETSLANLLQFETNRHIFSDFTISELLKKDTITWDEIKKSFKDTPFVFEKVFFQLHRKKKMSFTPLQLADVVKFFAIGYIFTNDVRYFNEFLWFADIENRDKKIGEICVSRFYENINDDKTHLINKTELSEANSLLKDNPLETTAYTPDTSKRICLIGNPVFFGKIHAELEKDGYHVEQYFIPYHSSKLLNFIISNPVLLKTACVLSGNRYSYKTLKFEPKNERIREILDSRNFDIGFHKLNFIIRKNIIDAFKIGLINDHWAMLPFLRGKSTIAWSLLLGFPLASTLHFTETGIDSGPISGFAMVDIKGKKKLKNVREVFRNTTSKRIIAAIRYISSPQYKSIRNEAAKGRTYYEMHPWLIKYIEANIITK